MRESDATVFRRLLELRQHPVFARSELDELATLADNAMEVAFPAGTIVAAANARVPRLHLVIEGRIEMPRPGATLAWGPHEVFGILEVLAGRPTAYAATAIEATRTLQLSGVDLADLLEDNFGILVSMLRELARWVAGLPVLPAAAALPPPITDSLGLVERLIVLRQQPLLARAKLQALSMLAQVSTEVTWPTGTPIERAGELRTQAVFVLDGTVRGDAGERYTAGDSFGLVETIAGLCCPSNLTAATPVRALVSTEAAVFDVLEDHTGLGLAMLERMAHTLLEAPPTPDRAN